jgi:pimeloyl-ACP methyl ester carboxylesterase
MMLRLPLVFALMGSVAAAQTTTTLSVSVQGRSFMVDRYLPAGNGPFPLVGLGHGFSLSKDNVRGLAQALQADGFAVVAPQLTGGLSVDHSLNADVLNAAVNAVIMSGQGDMTNVGLGGHSAGGLAAWLAASRRQGVTALMLFDPVDSMNSLGVPATSMVTAPTLFAFAPPQSCNSMNNSLSWFTSKVGAKGRFNVVMANHCDPTEPQSSTCNLACGPSFITPATWSATRSALYKRYARSFFNQFMRASRSMCVEQMAPGDVAANAINQVDLQLGNLCGADGGVPMGGGSAGGGSAGGSTAGGAAGGSMAGGVAGGAAGGSTAGGAAGGSAAGGTAGGSTAGGAAGGGSAGGSTSGGAAGGATAAGGTSGTGGGTPALSCGPSNCTGCCNGNTCVPSSDNTCGANGSACAICSAAQMCEAGRCTSTPAPGCSCATLEPGLLLALALLGALRRRHPVS